MINLDLPDAEYCDSAILATISYPPAYPSVAPDITLSHSSYIPRPPHLDLSSDNTLLLEKLQAPIEDNLDTQMIFTLISTLKEEIESLITSRLNAVQEEKEKVARQAEEKENEKFAGEKVTKERFLEWRQNLREEMQNRKREEEERK